MDAEKRGTSVGSARRSLNQERRNQVGSRRKQQKPMQWQMKNLHSVEERIQHWLFHQNLVLADSACTSHIVWDQNIFIDYTLTPGHQISGFGKTPALGQGTVQLEATVKGKTLKITLKNAVHSPNAPYNLISISCAIEAGVAVLFSTHGVKF